MARNMRAWLKNVMRRTLVMPARPPAAINAAGSMEKRVASFRFTSLAKRRSHRCLGVNVWVRCHAGNNGRYQHVKHRAYQEGGQDAERNVALRPHRFFRMGRDGIEADEGKEHD